jgi:hypothetical protein
MKLVQSSTELNDRLGDIGCQVLVIYPLTLTLDWFGGLRPECAGCNQRLKMATKMEQSTTFSFVTNELAKLGAIPLTKFADPTFVAKLHQSGFNAMYGNASGMNNESDMEPHDAYAFLNNLMTKLFGSSNGLNYKLHREPNCDCRVEISACHSPHS